MAERENVHLYRVKESGQVIMTYLRSTNMFQEFAEDRMRIDAVERELLKIKQSLSSLLEFKQLDPNDENQRLIELGELILHTPDMVPPEIIWGVVHKELPVVIEQATKLLPQSK